MPMFFFHYATGDTIERDEWGTELPDLQAAKGEALTDAREMWCDAITRGETLFDQTILITDEHGNHLASMPLEDALPEGLRRH